MASRAPHLAFWLVVLAASGVAAQTAPLEGTFSSKDISFQVDGGAAFTGKSSLDPDMPVILVAITNAALNAGELANFVDRKRAIEHLVKETRASLLVEGESAIGKVSGEVLLVNVKGVWSVDEELVDLVIGR
jgi:hypothetical protein